MDLKHKPHFGVTFVSVRGNMHYIFVSHGKDRLMSNSSNYRTLKEWQDLIQKARRSGMTDAQWCLSKEIRRNSFNSAIKRLPKKPNTLP